MSLSDLVLSIADNKQMLGLRYAEWATRAPSLEADIAAAAMGLDDLGHSRVLYGCLEPLGEDPRGPDRETDPSSVRSLPYFDEPWTEWGQFVAANSILDTAFTTMIEACVGGSVEVLQHRLRKMLMEERYHFLHGRTRPLGRDRRPYLCDASRPRGEEICARPRAVERSLTRARRNPSAFTAVRATQRSSRCSARRR